MHGLILILLNLIVTTDPLVITIDHDNTTIAQSCTLKIVDQPILDADDNGVIQVTADNITVDFNNQKLRGSKTDQLPDTFAGIGVKITGKNVTLTNANISGFRVGIHALNADGLTIANCDVSDNFQQHLKSTPEAEDASDWLWPHANDNHEWMNNYGASICVESSNKVTLHDIKTRHGQNGIILDRVNDSKVYDCDCSFLSGWGLAMWRSNRNLISRNAFDFCVRGYSHGVYNRGQDSAGILMFEQCCNNVIAENSATHCGDGFFGFAGKEALGEVNPRDDLNWYKRRGCNDNVFIGNDFSFAVAHGLELTFSFGNQIWTNQFFKNAICGIWAGYSQDSVIAECEFLANGDMAYGLERGGINIEHGQRNLISQNRFQSNKCGVHLWWDDDPGLVELPWAKINGALSTNNRILLNTFAGDDIEIQLRQTTGTELLLPTNAQRPQFDADQPSRLAATLIQGRTGPAPAQRPDIYANPAMAPIGTSQPVASRAMLAGREHIIITEWGPYDWEFPYLQRIENKSNQHTYRLLGPKFELNERGIAVEGDADAIVEGDRIIVKPHAAATIVPYSFSTDVNGTRLTRSGVLIDSMWQIIVFPYTTDPRQDVDAWHKEAEKGAIAFTASSLNLPYRNGGPSDLKINDKLTIAKLPKDHFGTIATTHLTMPAGQWRIKTVSDDGIRVWLDDQLIIDDWTWHGPTEHSYELNLDQPKLIEFRVEHFELDGYAMLSLDIDAER